MNDVACCFFCIILFTKICGLIIRWKSIHKIWKQ